MTVVFQPRTFLCQEAQIPIKMPCTCGKCIAGVLSPRNAAVIGEAAAAAAELLRDSLPEFPGTCLFHVTNLYVFKKIVTGNYLILIHPLMYLENNRPSPCRQPIPARPGGLPA